MGKKKKPRNKKRRTSNQPTPSGNRAIVMMGWIQKVRGWAAFLAAGAVVAFALSKIGPLEAKPPTLGHRVIAKFPHDPDAFTQGLVYLNGKLYESTGLRGQSTLRAVDPASGQLLKRHDLSADLFGEGLAFYKGVLVQLTYHAGRAFVYNSTTFEVLREYAYDGEGWGLTFDGEYFVMSNGSSTLQFRDPISFEIVRELTVTLAGEPLDLLNEMEFIEGEIWANVWQDSDIYRIDPKTGKVAAVIDMAGLVAEADRNGREDVLNGIAYDPANKRIFVTGKRFSYLYQIELVP